MTCILLLLSKQVKFDQYMRVKNMQIIFGGIANMLSCFSCKAQYLKGFCLFVFLNYTHVCSLAIFFSAFCWGSCYIAVDLIHTCDSSETATEVFLDLTKTHWWGDSAALLYMLSDMSQRLLWIGDIWIKVDLTDFPTSVHRFLQILSLLLQHDNKGVFNLILPLSRRHLDDVHKNHCMVPWLDPLTGEDRKIPITSVVFFKSVPAVAPQSRDFSHTSAFVSERMTWRRAYTSMCT